MKCVKRLIKTPFLIRKNTVKLNPDRSVSLFSNEFYSTYNITPTPAFSLQTAFD